MRNQTPTPFYQKYVFDDKFAYRLRDFVKDVTVCDAMNDEERDYILYVTQKLIDFQEKKTDECPFEGWRLVHNMTFALRLQLFLNGITPESEDLTYLRECSEHLVKYQCETVEDNYEYEYLKNNGLL